MLPPNPLDRIFGALNQVVDGGVGFFPLPLRYPLGILGNSASLIRLPS